MAEDNEVKVPVVEQVLATTVEKKEKKKKKPKKKETRAPETATEMEKETKVVVEGEAGEVKNKKSKKKSKKPKSSNDEKASSSITTTTTAGSSGPESGIKTETDTLEKKEKKPKKTKKSKKEKTSKDSETSVVKTSDATTKGEPEKKEKKSKKSKKVKTTDSTNTTNSTDNDGETEKKSLKEKDDKEKKKSKKKDTEEKKSKEASRESFLAIPTSDDFPEIPIDTSASAPIDASPSVGKLGTVTVNNIPHTTTVFDLTHIKGTEEAPIETKNDFKIHSRVDYGTKGTKVDVLTNHVCLTVGDDVSGRKNSELDPWWKSTFIYIYHIDFKPHGKPRKGGEGDRGKPAPPPAPLSKSKKYELVEALFHEDETLYKYKDRIAFNGEETLYSHIPLEEFTLFDGCWDISNKQKKKKVSIEGLNNNSKEEMNELVSQVTLKFVSKIGLSAIYKDTLGKNPEDQENKMSAPDKIVLLSLLGVKFLKSTDPIFQVHGNKFFIYNQYAKAIPFQIGAYLIHGFTVSLRYSYGSVLLNTVNVALPFYKHTKYLPGDPKFNENDETPYTLMDWIFECYDQVNAQHSGGKPQKGKPSEKDINFFIEKNRDIKNLIKGLKCYRPYINYSVNPDGTPKPPKKMQSKGIVGFARETATSMKFKISPSDVANQSPVPGEKEIMIDTNDYFAKKYNIKLKYPGVKLVSLGGSNVVPAECLTIVPGQKLRGRIYDEKAVIDFTALRPDEKFRAISRLALPSIKRALSGDEENVVVPHDSDYSFLKVPSRVVDAPTIQFQTTQIKYEDKPYGTKVPNSKAESQETKGNWNLQGHQFIQSPSEELTLRAIFINDSNRAPSVSIMEDAKKSLNKFASDVASVGVKFNVSPQLILINEFDSPVKKVVGGFSGRDNRGGRGGHGGRSSRGQTSWEITPGEEKLVELLSSVPPKSYIFFILSKPNQDTVYNRLKYLADLKFGVVNSCVVWNNFRKNSIQYNINVVMKMNLKLKGINHTLSSEDLKPLKDEETGLPFMVLGADVTHYPEKEQNSIAALVGSFDDKFAQYPGNYILQDGPGEETISRIGSMVYDRLRIYHAHNDGKLPPKILFYRDGTSESQFQDIVKVEVKDIKEALRKAGSQLLNGAKYDPPVTAISVVKRNQVRFMPLHENAINEKGETAAVQSMGNVMPGTVVDRGITSSAHFDFFLQSQQALKGTGVPCHYWCIYDENQFNSDFLQQVTHALCYMFGRSSTGIKVASPVYYADILCERAAAFFKANYNVVKFEHDKSKKNRTDPIPPTKLLPAVNDKIKDIMYYI